MIITSALIAYIDPGSGGLLLQVLLASLLTLGVCFRGLLLAPWKLFSRRRPTLDEPRGPAAEADVPMADGVE
jgi:hypothetical protein